MNRVIAVVEGQTERTFIRDVLAPWLGWKGVILSARLVGKPGSKGGATSFRRAQNDMLSLLKQESDTYVTTMFDFYGMPDEWPGRIRAKRLTHHNKAPHVERAIREKVLAELGADIDERRLFPYIQMHEFEALLFSEPAALSHVMREPDMAEDLQSIRDEFDTPEEINDNPTTAPSKRIGRLFHNYRKPFHGLLASRRITIELMRKECPHFDEWVAAMEELGTEAEDGEEASHEEDAAE